MTQSNPEPIWQRKYLRAGGAGVSWAAPAELSAWRLEGQPSHGAIPAAAPTWTNPTNTTAGGLQQQQVIAPNTQQWLKDVTGITWGGFGASKMILYDLLGFTSGLSGVVTGAQNVNGGSPGTLTRWGPSYAGVYTNPRAITGDGNEILLETYLACGATSQTVTATYANSHGVASQVSQAVTFNRNLYNITRLPLAAGDTGVQSLTSIALSGSTGTAGNIGAMVVHRVLEIASALETPDQIAAMFQTNGPYEILPGACLFWVFSSTTTPSGNVYLADAFFNIVDA